MMQEEIGLKNVFVSGRLLRWRVYLGKTYEMEGQFAMHSIYHKDLVLIIYENVFQSWLGFYLTLFRSF